MQNGDPVMLKVTHPVGTATGYATANMTTFTLDTSTYDANNDGSSTNEYPFKNKTFFICGIVVNLGNASDRFGGILVDGRNIIDYNNIANSANQNLKIGGLALDTTNTTTDKNSPKVDDMWSVPFMPCRYNIKVWAAAGDATTNANMYFFFNGYTIERRY